MMPQGNPMDVLKVQGQLFNKVLKVLTKVEKIEQSGYNKHQDYHYSTEKDLVDSIRQLLVDNNLIILTDSETKEVIKLHKYDKGAIISENLVTVVNTRHTFCDTESGYTYSVQSTGTGFDNTDKGAFKAVTGAMKYFISKNFLVATEDDPENDGASKPRATASQSSATKGFSRKATVMPTVTNDEVEKKVTAPIIADVKEEIVIKEELAPVVKPSFGRRASKSEPSFP